MEIIFYISFITGFLSILSPCILPILPIFLAFTIKSKSRMERFSFDAGLISIFLIVIILTAFFTQITYSYIIYVRFIASIVLLILGLMLIFNYSIKFKAFSSNIYSDGIISSFVLGIITSIAWAPCYGPYLISLISMLVALNNVTYVIFNLLLYCIGFFVALYLIGYLISKINIQQLISKTRYIQLLFAAMVILTSIYLLYTSLNVIL